MDGDLFTLLKEREGRIERAERDGYLVRGRELAAIRDGKLYRERYQTFEAYCEARWEMTPQHAGRLIAAADFATRIEHICSIPVRQTHIYPLLTDKLDDEDRLAVWREVLDAAGGLPRNVKAADIANAVAARMPPSLSRVSGDADEAVDDEAAVDSDDPSGVIALAEEGRMGRRASKPPASFEDAESRRHRNAYVFFAQLLRSAPEEVIDEIARMLTDARSSIITDLRHERRVAFARRCLSAVGVKLKDLRPRPPGSRFGRSVVVEEEEEEGIDRAAE